jgi:hypothetical protein
MYPATLPANKWEFGNRSDSLRGPVTSLLNRIAAVFYHSACLQKETLRSGTGNPIQAAAKNEAVEG